MKKIIQDFEKFFDIVFPTTKEEADILSFSLDDVINFAQHYQSEEKHRQKDTTEKNTDTVNHPSHYNQGQKEVISLMIELFGKKPMYHFCLLSAFKYRMRAGYKGDAATDIQKAMWYEAKAKEL